MWLGKLSIFELPVHISLNQKVVPFDARPVFCVTQDI